MKNTPPKHESREVVDEIAATVMHTFYHFGIPMALVEAREGFRDYHISLRPHHTVRMKLVETFKKDLEYALNSTVDIEAPIPGRMLVGVVVSKNAVVAPLPWTDAIQASELATMPPLTVPLGMHDSNTSAYLDLATAPHLICAGSTGSGKTTFLHTIIASLVTRNTPEELRLILIDTKQIEFDVYEKLPHLMTPPIDSPKKALMALKWAYREIERRFDILAQEHHENIATYHEAVYKPAYQAAAALKGHIDTFEEKPIPEALPYIVIVIDELSDISAEYLRELETSVVRLAQFGRAVGVHLIMATSRPSAKVITGMMRANIPTRIAFSVPSYSDSRAILDQNGAEKLEGSGDMLYASAYSAELERIQGYAITRTELAAHLKRLIAEYNKENDLYDSLEFNSKERSNDVYGTPQNISDDDEEDDLYEEAKAHVQENGKASTSFLQRRLRIGYSRAARLIDLLEERGVIGPADGAKPREVRKD